MFNKTFNVPIATNYANNIMHTMIKLNLLVTNCHWLKLQRAWWHWAN